MTLVAIILWAGLLTIWVAVRAVDWVFGRLVARRARRTLDGELCEVCGRPATVEVTETWGPDRELDPEVWSSISAYFCAEHAPPPDV